MDLKWRTAYMEKPVETHDCNRCKWLNLTEEQQRKRASQGLPVISIPHICEKYNKRVFHRTSSRIHDRFLWPCNNCVKDAYEHCIERSKYE